MALAGAAAPGSVGMMAGQDDAISGSWQEHQRRLQALAARQLFFVGGPPRSGTTWLQQLLDSHPEVCCRGEGLFQHQLAGPLDALVAARREGIAAKNGLFGHTGGYPLPGAQDADVLLGTGVLLALSRQMEGRDCRAVGEKTPENVFLFARLRRLFPAAKFIGIARDPRDVLTSAWHMFHRARPGQDDRQAKLAMVRAALPSLDQGARTMLDLRRTDPSACMIVTYEAMRATPAPVAVALYRFLGVADDADIVARCVAETSFTAQAGRAAGDGRDGTFLRKGVVGDWRSTLSDEMSELILDQLGWMFPEFGWAR